MCLLRYRIMWHTGIKTVLVGGGHDSPRIFILFLYIVYLFLFRLVLYNDCFLNLI